MSEIPPTTGTTSGPEDVADRWLADRHRHTIERARSMLDVEAGLQETLLARHHAVIQTTTAARLDVEAGLREITGTALRPGPVPSPAAPAAEHATALPDDVHPALRNLASRPAVERLRYGTVAHLDQILNRMLQVSRAVALVRTLAHGIDLDLDIDRAYALARDLALDHDHARDLALALDHDHDHARDRDRDLARDLALARDRDRDLTFARDLDRALDLARARALARARNLARDLARARDLYRDLYRDHDRDLARARNHARARARARNLDRDLARARNHARNLDRALDRDLYRALYRDLVQSLDRFRRAARDQGGLGAVLGLEPEETAHLVRQAERLLFDMSGADLSAAAETGLRVADLDRVRWSPDTIWPPGWKQWVRENSVELQPGVWEVRPGTSSADTSAPALT